jgi:hypothetical protein
MVFSSCPKTSTSFVSSLAASIIETATTPSYTNAGREDISFCKLLSIPWIGIFPGRLFRLIRLLSQRTLLHFF